MQLARTIRNRLGSNVRLAMAMLFAAVAFIGITPFAVVRAIHGDWAIVALDVSLLLLIIGNATYAWRTGSSDIPGKINAVVVSLACSLMAGPLGTAGLFWVYTVILANYMLAPRLLATICSAVLIVAGLVSVTFPYPLAAGAFGVSALLVVLYSLIFASFTEAQRTVLEGLATRDPLTGIANRRSMELELADAVTRLKLQGEIATLAVLDLDHFKSVNDNHGHDLGDQVIIAFTKRVQSCIRKRDRLFRLGGEEFVLLLSGTDDSGARAALEKVRDAVQAQPLVEDLRITTSIGAAILEPADDWPRWLARADSALYVAKDTGRDRVSFNGNASRPSERRLLRLVSGRPTR